MTAPTARPHQFLLFRQRRFSPFFWSVFLGAVNDNLLKFAIVLLLTYRVPVPWLPPEVVGSALGGLFMLPSVLLSATTGQWADKVPLDGLIRWGKSAEIVMMLLAGWALWQGDAVTMLVCVLLSGMHVTLFSTIKYAYLPRHLAPDELTGGNGLLEMGTFTAILLGTVAGGLLLSPGVTSIAPLIVAVMVLAVLGRLAARGIPATPALSPALRMNWNVLAETWRNLDRIHHQPVLWMSILGISWMWFFGAVFLTLFPVLSMNVLHAGEDVASVLLVLTSVGIAVGALLCEGLSRSRKGEAPRLGLVLVGGLGMAAFGLDMAWVVHQIAGDPGMAAVKSYGLADFVTRPLHWRGAADQVLMAMSIGVFSVPLYAQMQYLAEPERRARIVAANNIVNAVFILVSAAMTGVLAALGFGLGAIFAITCAMQFTVLLLAMWWQPVLWQEAVAWARRWGREPA
ncbi:MAG: MFS transporter [Aquabacterium sp.]